MKRISIFASCDSFEGFYGGTFGLTREEFLRSYRNDFIWEYSEGLCRGGHQVFIYILSYGPAEVRKLSPNLSVRFIPLPRWLRVADVALFRMQRLPKGPFLRDLVAFQGYKNTLQRALLEDGIDVLYNQEIWTPRFDLLVDHLKLPVVGADHGAVYADWMEPAKRRSFPRAAKLICQSITNLDRATAFGGNAELMYNSVDTDFFTPGEPPLPRAKMVLSVGRFVEAQKRFSDLLKAMRLLPDYELTLAGTGVDEGKLKNLAAALGIADRVHFPGFVSSREELRDLYRRCGVFVSSSSWEAVALVLLEAMSCEAPVVATRIPSFMDLLKDGQDGLLIPVGDPEAIADGVQRAYALRDQLGHHARQTVQAGYSSGALYQRLSELMDAIQTTNR